MFNRFAILLICVALLFCGTLLFSQSAFAEGNIGFNYSQIIDDTSWGVIGDYEHDAGPFDFEVEGQLQSGAIYNGTVDTAITFDVSSVGIRLFSNNKLKGYTLDGLGRTNDVGAALVIPTGDLEIAVGVFGRNGNPFGKPNAKDDLVPLGYNEDTLLSLGLDILHPAPKGLTIEGGNSLNASVETEFDAGRFEIELKGLLEIAGEGEKVHQFLTNIATDGDLAIGLNWQAAVNIALQKYGETLEWESAWFVGVGKKF